MSNKQRNFKCYKMLSLALAIIFISGCGQIKQQYKKVKPVVNIITDIPKEHFVEYMDFFNLTYPDILLNTTHVSSGEAFHKLIKEGKTTDIDIWLGNSIEDTILLDKSNILEAYKPKNFDRIPKAFKDNKNYIPHWTGFTAYTIGIAAKVEVEPLIKEDLLKGLTSEELGREIAITNPETTASGYLFISYIYYKYGEENSRAIFKALKKNIKLSENSSYNIGRQINEDNVKLSITTDYDALFSQWDDYDVTLYKLEDGAAPYNIESAALIKKDNIKKESEIFLDWVLGDTAAGLNRKYRNILIDGNKSSIEGAFPIELSPTDLYKRAEDKEKIIKLWKEK